jgi:alcohol dehydrogenase class IV
MPSFVFFNIPKIVFGRGQIARLAELAAPLGKTPLVVHSAAALPIAEKHLPTFIPFQQKGEPTTTDVDRALQTARNKNCDCLIAIGGGSAIDCAKAVAGLLTNTGNALDYMEVVGKGQKITRPAAPWIAIPTTAGTGAEATRNAVIGYGGGNEKNFKASIRSELLLPKIALIDPELALNLPPHVTASSGMDALCQCIEAYTSTGGGNANPLTGPLALEGAQRAARSLKKAFDNPADLDAREDMALAALLSGIALTNAGLGAVHGFAAPLGANFPIPHGTLCAALLPHVIAANIHALQQQNHPSLARYLTLARTLTNQPLPDDQALSALVTFVDNLLRDLQIPRLATYGLTPADNPTQVALAQKSSSMRYNPIPLPPETLTQILTAAL